MNLQETYELYDCLYVQGDLSRIDKTSQGNATYSITSNGIKLEASEDNYALFYMNDGSGVINKKWIPQPFSFEFKVIDCSDTTKCALRADTDTNNSRTLNQLDANTGSIITGTLKDGLLTFSVDGVAKYTKTIDNNNARFGFRNEVGVSIEYTDLKIYSI